MIYRKCLCLFFISLFAVSAKAQPGSFFDKGSQEFGLGSLGIGYSSLTGIAFRAGGRYQYYVMNRFSVGGGASYNTYDDKEVLGAGPALSWIFATHKKFFTRLDQRVTATRYNGFSETYATWSGTTGVSLNYRPYVSNYSIGAGYAHSYALSDGKIPGPGSFHILIGWFWD